MAGFQQLIITGNVGRVDDLRYTPNGKAVITFSVAVTERWGSGDNKKENTTWFRVTSWEREAEIVKEYVQKGAPIMVIGKINASAYIPKDGGEPRASLEMTSSRVILQGSKGESNGGNNAPAFDEHGWPVGADDPATAATAPDKTTEEEIDFNSI